MDPRAHKRKGDQDLEARTSRRSNKEMGDKGKGKRLVRSQVIKKKTSRATWFFYIKASERNSDKIL